jgi:hypothetical protein
MPKKRPTPLDGDTQATPVDVLNSFFPDGFTYRDEANALTACAFRNGMLEDLHAGDTSAIQSDPSISRLTDDEMKAMMIDASTRLAALLKLKEKDPVKYLEKILWASFNHCREWDRE